MNIIFYIFLIAILYFFYRTLFCETFTDNIYLSKTELEKTLINNRDKYYDTFNNNDLIVRNIENIENYYDIIKNSCQNITNLNQDLIDEAINIANNKIKKININGFNGKKLADVQWIIGVITGKEYEYGLPHTRNFVIIIPDYIINNKLTLTRILIHEKIHIYQKMFPEDAYIWIRNNGFTKHSIRNKNDNIRANPDIDNIIYVDKEERKYMSIYNELPLTINDVKYFPINDYKYEHPLELMAYTLEDIINR
jgi:hypothetical protein